MSSLFGLDLLQRALVGDAASTRALVRTVLVPVIQASICHEFLRAKRSHVEVEDAVQEVLTHLCEGDWGRLRSFDPGRGPLAAYVSRIAHNYAIDILRRRRPPEPVADVEMVASDAVPDSGPEGKVSLGEQLDRLVEALGDDDLLLVRWLWFEGLDRAEIAARLGISSAALYKRASRLEARVRGLLSNEEREDRMSEGTSS